jgi:glycosyltransferase involved in cell wall biosynthesis
MNAISSLHFSPSISVVVPVYNSEAILPELAARIARVLAGLPEPFELILVNDGSQDQSWAAISALAAEYPWVRGINLMRNYGQHNALLAGIRAAQYEVIVTLDDDLQNPPEEIPKLLEKLSEGYDFVYGIPSQQQHGFWRNMASGITKLALQSVMGVQAGRNISAFRAFRTQVRAAFANYEGAYVSIDVLLSWGAARFTATQVRHDPRDSGASAYSFRKLVAHALDLITGFSTLPLRVASLMGFAFTLFGAGVLVYVLVRYFIAGGSIPGFPFLASTLAIFSGVQLFALGVIGEYLARIHFRSMGRPSSAIRGTVGFPADEKER